MASLDDILTTQKNGVIAINAYVTAINFHAGQSQSREIAATTVVKTSSGWVANISVIVAGSAVGYIYDTNNSGTLTGNRIYTIPNTVGTYTVNMPTNNGITIVPGTGQTVAIGYS
jgi:hypothetical protein